MGPSGAGKTTLLSLLSKRDNRALKVEGNVGVYWFRFWQIQGSSIKGLFTLSGLSFISPIFYNRLWPWGVNFIQSRNFIICCETQNSWSSRSHGKGLSPIVWFLAAKMPKYLCWRSDRQRHLRRRKEKSLHRNWNVFKTLSHYFRLAYLRAR